MNPKEEKLSLIIAEPGKFHREALTEYINNEDGFTVAAQAKDGFELVKLYKEHQSSLILSEICLPGLTGFEAVYKLRSQHPGMKALLFGSLPDTELFLCAAIKAGANGLVSKDSDANQLFHAIETVQRGKYSFLGRRAPSLECWKPLMEIYDKNERLNAYCQFPCLSSEEKQLIVFLSRDLIRKEIATILNNMPSSTLDSHIKKLLAKFNMENFMQVFTFLLRLKPELVKDESLSC